MQLNRHITDRLLHISTPFKGRKVKVSTQPINIVPHTRIEQSHRTPILIVLEHCAAVYFSTNQQPQQQPQTPAPPAVASGAPPSQPRESAVARPIEQKRKRQPLAIVDPDTNRNVITGEEVPPESVASTPASAAPLAPAEAAESTTPAAPTETAAATVTVNAVPVVAAATLATVAAEVVADVVAEPAAPPKEIELVTEKLTETVEAVETVKAAPKVEQPTAAAPSLAPVPTPTPAVSVPAVSVPAVSVPAVSVPAPVVPVVAEIMVEQSPKPEEAEDNSTVSAQVSSVDVAVDKEPTLIAQENGESLAPETVTTTTPSPTPVSTSAGSDIDGNYH